jgi:hypothetical protein
MPNKMLNARLELSHDYIENLNIVTRRHLMKNKRQQLALPTAKEPITSQRGLSYLSTPGDPPPSS